MKAEITRQIKAYEYFKDEKSFVEDILKNVDYLVDNYDYQVNTDPVAIKKDILAIVGTKADWYHHHVVIYYNEIGCYVVFYRYRDIVVNIYTGKVNKNGYCGLAHGIGKSLIRE